MEFVRLLLAAMLSVAALFVITKLMGHKQVAQLDFFDYVSGITIGSIGAELATELEKQLKTHDCLSTKDILLGIYRPEQDKFTPYQSR